MREVKDVRIRRALAVLDELDLEIDAGKSDFASVQDAIDNVRGWLEDDDASVLEADDRLNRA